MPITFDTMEELIRFYQTFSLDKTATTRKTKSVSLKEAAEKSAAKKKPGRKAAPKKAAAKKTTAKKVTKKATAKKAAPKKPAAKKAVAKKTTAKKVTKKPVAKKAVAKKAKTTKAPAKTVTLTGRIKSTIQQFLDNKKSFTANDIYDAMAKQDKSINKQSVITSVLKQMNTTFSNVKVTERPGAGPRPVKLYNA